MMPAAPQTTSLSLVPPPADLQGASEMGRIAVPAELAHVLDELRAAVQAALAAKDGALVEREATVREQAVALARLEARLEQSGELEAARLQAASEARLRLEASNQQLLVAVDERDRKLVLFSRKLDQLRAEAQQEQARRSSERRRREELVAELASLKWHQRSRRKELLAELHALA